MEKIRDYLQEQGEATTSDISEQLTLSVARTRAILSEMEDVEVIGKNKSRKYRLKQENE